MKRREDLYLVDMVEACDAITEYVNDLNDDAFAANPLARDAVVWRLMIIGEASGKLSPALKDRFENIPWEQVRAFRNRLVHGYFDLRWKEVWLIVKNDVPRLREQVERMLAVDFPETYQKLTERRQHGRS